MKAKKLLFNKDLALKLILISTGLSLWTVLSSYLIYIIYGVEMGRQNHKDSDFKTFVIVVLIVPVFETLFFQFLIIYQTYESYKGINKKQLAIFISSLLFGLSHFYSSIYFLSATVAGFLLASSFCYFRDKSNYLTAIFYVTIIHFLSNLLVFSIKVFDL